MIQAIRTKYNNIYFRSRLEARWAVFMDELGVKWIYEPEGFTDGKICYLPDFYLPELNTYLEIKPITPLKEEEEKCELLTKITGCPVVCMFGQPIDYLREDTNGGFLYNYFSHSEYGYNWTWDNYQRFCVCMNCGKTGIEYENRADRLLCKCEKKDGRYDVNLREKLNYCYFIAQNYSF